MIDVVRRAEAPASLALRKAPDGPDVRRALWEDFLGKCYLCETRVHLSTFQVDHREPENEAPDRIYDWTNLFPTCTLYACNQHRFRKSRPGGWLSPGEGVERRLSQEFIPGQGPRFLATSGMDAPASNLADELNHLHNEPGSVSSDDLVQAIRIQVEILSAVQMRLLGQIYTSSIRPLDVFDFQTLTHRSAPYYALVRSTVHPLLEQFLPEESRAKALP